jgi:hypothetical protein
MTVEYDGLKWTKMKGRGYYQCTKAIKPRNLHQYIWQKHNGEQPAGYDVHHIDHNKDNNDISNLELISRKDHAKHHGQHWTEERKAKQRQHLEAIKDKAAAWHKSPEGREWHSKNALGRKKPRHKGICSVCGNEYEYAKSSQANKYCSNKCAAKARRDSGIDNIDKQCVICGKWYNANKYSRVKTCSPSCGSKLSHITRKQNKGI